MDQKDSPIYISIAQSRPPTPKYLVVSITRPDPRRYIGVTRTADKRQTVRDVSVALKLKEVKRVREMFHSAN
jgi:hypothetical protein